MKRWLSLGCVLLLLTGGCNRQDRDALTKLGKRLSGKVQEGMTQWKDHWTRNLAPTPGPTERVRLRLQFEKNLEGAKIEVAGTAERVELKGKILSAGQRQRAVELAESTTGVAAVTDSLEE